MWQDGEVCRKRNQLEFFVVVFFVVLPSVFRAESVIMASFFFSLGVSIVYLYFDLFLSKKKIQIANVRCHYFMNG